MERRSRRPEGHLKHFITELLFYGSRFVTFRVADDVDTHRRNRVPGQERYKHKLFKIAAPRCMSWGEL